MKVYLVGGAVRDKLLGLPVRERDWVVVGATPKELLKQGFKPVGKDFPVFLHPKTHEEYALARTERKTAKGYKGFKFYADTSVSLEEDLKRRDLTINAIAQDQNGKLIDPFGGVEDINNKCLRHVSAAFAEDPVRILRLARFAARFADFSIHAETVTLMRQMVNNGEVDALVPERVWQEFRRALGYDHPERFFTALKQCGALAKLFPELVDSPGVAALTKAVQQVDSLRQRFSILMSALTSTQVQALCQRLRVEHDFKDLALLVVNYQQPYRNVHKANAKDLLHLLEKTDALRRPGRFQAFISTNEVLWGHANSKIIWQAFEAFKTVAVQPLLAQGLSGEALGRALRQQRLAAISKIFSRDVL